MGTIAARVERRVKPRVTTNTKRQRSRKPLGCVELDWSVDVGSQAINGDGAGEISALIWQGSGSQKIHAIE